MMVHHRCCRRRCRRRRFRRRRRRYCTCCSCFAASVGSVFEVRPLASAVITPILVRGSHD